jgi:peptidoglycan/xylan/chitin deacetylase (PgdA/CDA1 family)
VVTDPAAPPRDRALVTQTLVARISRGVGALRPRPRRGWRILLYHSIGASIGAASAAGNGTRLAADSPVAVDDFERQMRSLISANGIRMVSLTDGLSAVANARPDETLVAVTFDDGYRDTLARAAPVLARLGIPFTVFVVGGFIERPPVPDRYLDAAGLRELATAPGASIGAHGHTHRPLSRLPDSVLVTELRASIDAIGSAIGRAPTTMSYPHGAVDRRVVAAAGRAGFTIGATSLIGTNRRGLSPLRLRRTEITTMDTAASFAGKVRGDFDWYQAKQRVYWPLPTA